MRRGVAFPLALVAVLAVAAFLVISSGSFNAQTIVAPAAIAQYDTGSRFYVTTLGLTSQDNVIFSVKGQGATFANGSKATPDGSSASLFFSPSNPVCSVGITLKDSVPVLNYYDTNGVYRTIPATNVYSVTSPRTSLPYWVQVTQHGKTASVNLDAAQAQSVYSFSDGDGKGLITITNIGTVAGAYSCGVVSDLGVSTHSGVVGAVSMSDWNSKLAVAKNACGNSWQNVPDQIFEINAACANALTNLGTNYATVPNGFVGASTNLRYPAGDFSRVLFDLPKNAQTGLITVSADADFYNTVYTVAPTVGVPVITASLADSSCAFSNSNKQITVTYKNAGTAQGQINVQGSTSLGTLTPAFFGGETLLAGQSKTVAVTLSTPLVTSTQNPTVSFTACSASQVSASQCATVLLNYCVQPVPTVTPSPSPTPPPDCELTNTCPVPDNWLDNLFESLRLTRLLGGSGLGGLALYAAIVVILAAGTLVLMGGSVAPFALPVFLVLIVAFSILFNVVDKFWELVPIGAFLYQHGKKKRWF